MRCSIAAPYQRNAKEGRRRNFLFLCPFGRETRKKKKNLSKRQTLDLAINQIDRAEASAAAVYVNSGGSFWQFGWIRLL